MSSGIPRLCIDNVACSSSVFGVLLLSVRNYSQNKVCSKVCCMHNQQICLGFDRVLYKECASCFFPCFAASDIDFVSV